MCTQGPPNREIILPIMTKKPALGASWFLPCESPCQRMEMYGHIGLLFTTTKSSLEIPGSQDKYQDLCAAS